MNPQGQFIKNGDLIFHVAPHEQCNMKVQEIQKLALQSFYA